MATEHFTNEHCFIRTHPQQRVLEFGFFPASFEMTNDEFRQFVRQILETSMRTSPKAILSNGVERQYAVPPDLQAWAVGLLVPAWNKLGCRRYAQVQPKEYFAKLSAQQIIEEAAEALPGMIQIKVFPNLEKAWEWLRARGGAPRNVSSGPAPSPRRDAPGARRKNGASTPSKAPPRHPRPPASWDAAAPAGSS